MSAIVLKTAEEIELMRESALIDTERNWGCWQGKFALEYLP